MLKIEDPTTELFSELRKVNNEQKEWLAKMRKVAANFVALLDELPNSRRKSIATSRLEDAVLYANKAATYGS